MIDLHLVVGSSAPPQQRDEVAEVERALTEVGLSTAVAGPTEGPPDAVHLVWSADFGDALAALPEEAREAWLDSAIIVNQPRESVVELLEGRALLGAVEYERSSEWREVGPAHLYVRRDAAWAEPGDDAIASEQYAAWAEPGTGSLADALAGYLAHWREVDAELVVGADEARARKLPPVELGLRLGGTGLFRVPAPHSPGYYVVLSSAPGGGAGFAARPILDGAGDDLESIARRMLQNPRGAELVASTGVERLRMAGREREAICLYADWLSFRTASCVVRLEHAGGAVLAIFICSIGETQPSPRTVLADPSLRRVSRSLRIADADAPGAGGSPIERPIDSSDRPID
jgi:hypothetical protein